MAKTLARHRTSGGVMASLFLHDIARPPLLAHGTPELQAEVIPAVLRRSAEPIMKELAARQWDL
jgi:acyl-CoA dehydrogenase